MENERPKTRSRNMTNRVMRILSSRKYICHHETDDLQEIYKIFIRKVTDSQIMAMSDDAIEEIIMKCIVEYYC